MAAYVPPRRTTSTASTITVGSALPSWMPPAGFFNDVRRSDTNTIHLPTAIDYNVYRADGSPTPYPNLFRGPAGGWEMMWLAQGGGTFNPELGASGSIIFQNGGHNAGGGTCVARFDIATGLWSQFVESQWAATDKTVSGGTVATLTGTVVNRVYPVGQEDSNARVSDRGNFCRYADDTVIPGTGPLTGGLTNNSDVSVWYPAPIHSGQGIRTLPSDAGGGSNGSMVIFGHDQTGITIPLGKQQIFKLDCATKVWSASLIGDWNPGSLDSPMLDYDQNRKVMWGQFPSGRFFALRWTNGPMERVRLTGPSVNQTNSSQPMFVYLPDRDMIVWIAIITNGVVGSNTAFRYPRLQGLKLNGTAWTGLTAFNGTAFNLRTNNITPGSDGYLAGVIAGTNTGWPEWRKLGGVYPIKATYPGEATYLGAADGGGLLTPGLGNAATQGSGCAVNDRLIYCPKDGCLYTIERDRPAAVPQYIRLWKLKGPAIGSETTGSWDWSYQDILCSTAQGCTGYAVNQTFQSPSYSGFFDWIPALEAFYLTNPGLPVQVIKPIFP